LAEGLQPGAPPALNQPHADSFAEAWWKKNKQGDEDVIQQPAVQPGRNTIESQGMTVPGIPQAKPGKGTENDHGKTPGTGIPAPKTGTDVNVRQGARISEGWGDKGEYKREVEADAPEDVWKLHQSVGGKDVDWTPRTPSPVAPPGAAQAQAQGVIPQNPQEGPQGPQLPEPEPQEMNGQVDPMQQPAVQQPTNAAGY